MISRWALHKIWARFWLRLSGRGVFGRRAARLAALFCRPYYGRCWLSRMSPKGYISPDAIISHEGLSLGANVFIGDGVIIFQARGGGEVLIGDGSGLYRDITIQTRDGGSLSIGKNTHIQPRCEFSALMSTIRIGDGVQIAPCCAFYPYDHVFSKGASMLPIKSKGGIVVEDDAWLGYGVIVLDGVRIGKGAVVGAGSVVKHDVPEGAIAAGVPAKVIGMRPE